jgi:hypothetical protein
MALPVAPERALHARALAGAALVHRQEGAARACCSAPVAARLLQVLQDGRLPCVEAAGGQWLGLDQTIPPLSRPTRPRPHQVSKDEYYKMMERKRQEALPAAPAEGGSEVPPSEGAPSEAGSSEGGAAKRSLKEKYDQF